MDNGKMIGEVGIEGQIIWDRIAGPMQLEIWNTLGYSERGLSKQTMRMCVGKGNTYNFRVYWPFTGGLKLELVSGTPVVCEQGETNGTVMAPEYIRQTTNQPDGAKDEKTLTGIIRKSTPIIGIKGYSGEAYN